MARAGHVAVHNSATMLQEAHSLTQESQRQRDHYHVDELTHLSVPVSTSSSSHDSPLMMLCMDQ